MDDQKTDPILIWGSGAIGGTIGAYLARAGAEIMFVDADPAHVDAINAHGLRITGPIDAFTAHAAATQAETCAEKNSAGSCSR